MKKNCIFFAIVLVLMAALIMTACSGSKEISDSEVDEALAYAAEEVNKTCPALLDEFTQLDSAEAKAGRILRYNYTFVMWSSADLTAADIDEISGALYPNIVEGIKYQDDMKALRDLKTIFQYYYKTSDGKLVIQLEITPEDYS